VRVRETGASPPLLKGELKVGGYYGQWSNHAFDRGQEAETSENRTRQFMGDGVIQMAKTGEARWRRAGMGIESLISGM